MATVDPDLKKRWVTGCDWASVGASIDALAVEVEELVPASTVVFCHNDLLCGNVIIKPGDEDVDFIDFEYGGANYRSFDIGNHFNEQCGEERTAPLHTRTELIGLALPREEERPWEMRESLSRSRLIIAALLPQGLTTFDYREYPDRALQETWLREYMAFGTG